MATLWERVKAGSKTGFDKTWQALDKVGAPVNRLSNKLGAEAFWPTTLDKECDKAARILKSFCKDGFYAEEEHQSADGPKQAQKVLKKIPASVIKNARGLAIFTTMRTGMWLSGAGGSGVLIARKDDGSWSPPSGILLHTAGLGFMIGIDIYDCVVVINSQEALEAFYKVRCTLGSEISVAAGPIGAGGVLDTEIHKRQAPIFTYMKSRGFYAGVQIDGTILIERGDENERFYGYRYPVKDILSGKVRHPPFEVRRLLETLKAAQGDTNFDASALPTEPPPSDYEVSNSQVFGVPAVEDPDPYGVLALEKQGLKIVEAGSQKRASWEQFSFNPSPTSPVHSYPRSSASTELSFSRRSSWRGSAMSYSTQPTQASSTRQSVDSPLKVSTTTMNTSAQNESTPSPILTWANGLERHSSLTSTAPSYRRMRDVPENDTLDIPPRDKTPLSETTYSTPPTTPPSEHEDSPRTWEAPDSSEHPASDADAAPAAAQVTGVQLANPIVAKARLVSVPKRTPPKLPPRNPERQADRQSPSPERPSVAVEPSILVAEPTSVKELDTKTAEIPVDAVRPAELTTDKDAVTLGETRLSTGSNASGSTWARIRALREADDDD